jgi:hypothetical protein
LPLWFKVRSQVDNDDPEDMDSYIHDQADHHLETVSDEGLSEEHASYHVLPMFRWLIERNLMSDLFVEQWAAELASYRRGDITLYRLYETGDRCLIGAMLSKEGNAFTLHYFDFARGKYLSDYIAALADGLPTAFHVVYSEDAYARMRPLIERRYAEWKQSTRKPWWRFWT